MVSKLSCSVTCCSAPHVCVPASCGVSCYLFVPAVLITCTCSVAVCSLEKAHEETGELLISTSLINCAVICRHCRLSPVVMMPLLFYRQWLFLIEGLMCLMVSAYWW